MNGILFASYIWIQLSMGEIWQCRAACRSVTERQGVHDRPRLRPVGFVSLLLAVLLGWLSLQGEGGCSGDNDAAALRHERETLLARQLEQFSCIRQARVQLAPQSWQSGAVIVLEPARPEAMPDAAALDRMLDTLALIPDAPDKRHVLVFDTEGRRLYPDHETDETARREQEVALERQALRVLRPLLDGNGRAGSPCQSGWGRKRPDNGTSYHLGIAGRKCRPGNSVPAS